MALAAKEMSCLGVLALVGLAAALSAVPSRSQEQAGALFTESFDDAQLIRRGWYDGAKFKIADREPFAGRGSVEYHWQAGATTPHTTATIRRLFEPTDTVYLRFHMKLSPGWGWTGRAYHPHLFQFMTTENGKFHGPAGSQLTLYVEPWDGKLRLAAQDIQNKDAPHGLTQGALKGGYNGKMYDSRQTLFTDSGWHRVEALFKLNSLDTTRDRPNADGVAQAWVDGKLVVDRKDLVFRSTDFPAMKINQLLLAPYFGPGLLPHEQTLWIDELALGDRFTAETQRARRGKEVTAEGAASAGRREIHGSHRE